MHERKKIYCTFSNIKAYTLNIELVPEDVGIIHCKRFETYVRNVAKPTVWVNNMTNIWLYLDYLLLLTCQQ